MENRTQKMQNKTQEAILFKNGKPWIKRGGKPFNVTMGSWDGAEVADLVGLYLLSRLSVLGINVGLYRDDGLAAVDLRPRLAELTKKKICQIFKEHGLNITATLSYNIFYAKTPQLLTTSRLRNVKNTILDIIF